MAGFVLKTADVGKFGSESGLARFRFGARVGQPQGDLLRAGSSGFRANRSPPFEIVDPPLSVPRADLKIPSRTRMNSSSPVAHARPARNLMTRDGGMGRI